MMELKGFAKRNGMVPLTDTSGIRVGVHTEKSKLTSEIAVPLQELFGADYSMEDARNDIIMEVKVNAIKGKERTDRSTAGYGPSNTEGAARTKTRVGGGKTGGGREHSENASLTNPLQMKEDRTDLYHKTEFKQRFVLSPIPN